MYPDKATMLMRKETVTQQIITLEDQKKDINKHILQLKKEETALINLLDLCDGCRNCEYDAETNEIGCVSKICKPEYGDDYDD